MPSQPLKNDRLELVKELESKLAGANKPYSRFVLFRKKFLWLFFVEGSKKLKRFLDIAISLILLVVLSPLMAIIAFIIRLDGKPIFYSTNRVGRFGKEFLFPKFRTMVKDSDLIKASLLGQNIHRDSLRFKMVDDPRITRFGKILRKSSLDELPQLWCVLKGDMSLVGPRPPLPDEVAKYTLKERARLDVLPGLTCFWQVEGRSHIPFDEQVKLDRKYIESQSVWLDLKLLIKTIPAVLMGKGAF